MTIQSFQEELQRIDPDLMVFPHPKIDALAGVYFQGVYLFGIPNHNIYNEPNAGYAIDLPNGTRVRHRTRPEAIAMVKKQIEQLKFNPDAADAILGRGKYSAEALKPETESNPIILP